MHACTLPDLCKCSILFMYDRNGSTQPYSLPIQWVLDLNTFVVHKSDVEFSEYWSYLLKKKLWAYGKGSISHIDYISRRLPMCTYTTEKERERENHFLIVENENRK